MSAKRSKKKLSKNSPYRKANMQQESEKKSRKGFYVNLTVILLAVLLTAGIVVAAVFIIKNSTYDPERLTEKAEVYLKENAYYVQITSSNSSTNPSLNEALKSDRKTASLTVDGENYLAMLPQGGVNISYFMFGDTFYVNEGALGIVTKESLKLLRENYKDDEAYAAAVAEVEKIKKENYGKYVTPYLNDFKLSDYEETDVTKGTGGTKTLVCSMLVESVASQFGAQYKDNPELSKFFEGAEVDRRRSTTTIIFDAEGRYSAIKTVYAIAVSLSDGTKELLMMNTERTFKYGDVAKLVEPNNSSYNVIEYGADNTEVFDEPFTVTTKLEYNEQKYGEVNIKNLKMILSGIFSSGFGDHTVRVDGKNYEISYNYGQAEDEKHLTSLIGDYLYTTFVKGEAKELSKTKASEYYNYSNGYYGRGGAYNEAVISAIMPISTRFFNTAEVKENSDGTYTIDYSTITEDFFFSLYESMNSASTSTGAFYVPEASGCFYTVKVDKDGRILSTRLKIHVSAVTDTTAMTPVAEAYIAFDRTFDYDTAESFYKNAKEGDKWVTLPEKEADYELIEEDYDDGYDDLIGGILGGLS